MVCVCVCVCGNVLTYKIRFKYKREIIQGDRGVWAQRGVNGVRFLWGKRKSGKIVESSDDSDLKGRKISSFQDGY